MKGNDHQCSLDIDEFAQMVKSIRTMEVALGGPMKRFQKCIVISDINLDQYVTNLRISLYLSTNAFIIC